MLYLLDANVLIDANRDYYPLGRVPEFWDWLIDRATKHQTKIPVEMYEEVLACISHHPTAEARHTTARTSLRLLAVLNVLFKYACARQAARASS